MMNRRLTALCGVILAIAPGCSWFRKQKPKPAPPVITAPPTTRTPPPEPPTVPPPPKVEGPKATNVPPPQTTTPVPTPPPKPPPKPPKKSRRASAPKQQPAPTPPATTPPDPTTEPQQPTVPQLTQLLSPAEQAAYNKAIDGAIERTRAKLARVNQRGLNAAQRATFERVQTFVQQAEETRAMDLTTAKTLAERADLLSDELVRQ